MWAALKAQWSSVIEAKYMTIPATLLTLFLDYTGSHIEALVAWLALSTADVVFGVILAVATHAFSVSKLGRWVFKVLVQLLTVLAFAAVLHTLTVTTGVTLAVANWLLLLFALTDFLSLMDKFLLLGYLPASVHVLVSWLRGRVNRSFAAFADDPELAQAMADALTAKHSPTPTGETNPG